MSDETYTETASRSIEHRPPAPKFQQGVTLDSANAINTKEMLSKDSETIPYIGNTSVRQTNTYTLMRAMAKSPVFEVDFLGRYAEIGTQYTCSKEGFRSKQVVEMNKASPIIEGGSLGDKMGRALHL